jgi:hypothetical protein
MPLGLAPPCTDPVTRHRQTDTAVRTAPRARPLEPAHAPDSEKGRGTSPHARDSAGMATPTAATSHSQPPSTVSTRHTTVSRHRMRAIRRVPCPCPCHDMTSPTLPNHGTRGRSHRRMFARAVCMRATVMHLTASANETPPPARHEHSAWHRPWHTTSV